jgi:ribose-phosphate pyrophosphokinase
MKIFSGTSHHPLAEKIASALQFTVSPLELFVFPDGEKRIRVVESVVDEQCVIVQSTNTPVAERYMELFFIVDALKRSGAGEVIVVMPYVGYQRQDHVFRSGEAVSLDVVVHALERSGASKVIVVDLHSIKIPEIFSVPVIHLSALSLFAKKIKQLGTGVLVSPDMGGLRRIQQLSELLDNMPWLATVKDRDLATGEITITSLEGRDKESDLRGKQAFLVDDMISSGGTIITSAELLKKKGVKTIFAFVTHAIFSQEAPRLLQNSVIDRVYVTDSVFISEEKRFSKLEIVSIAREIASSLIPHFSQ